MTMGFLYHCFNNPRNSHIFKWLFSPVWHANANSHVLSDSSAELCNWVSHFHTLLIFTLALKEPQYRHIGRLLVQRGDVYGESKGAGLSSSPVLSE